MSPFVFILISILLSAFFSGIEIAFVSADRFYTEVQSKKGNFAYKIISFLSKNPSMFIASMLVGNNMALVLYGIFMPDVLQPLLGAIPTGYFLLLVQTVISTIIILIFAEFLPKSFFITRPQQMLSFFSYIAAFFYFLFYLVVMILVPVSNFLLGLFIKKEEKQDNIVFSIHDLSNYLNEATQTLDLEREDNHEVRILKNALDMESRKVREFMVPRTEIVAVPIDISLEDLRELFIESNLTKIVVYRENIDNIAGYVHSFEFFYHNKNMASLLRPIRYVTESTSASQLLKIMTKENRSIAIIFDEFGGTSGLITIEDVIEELFGEIDDEHDVAENQEIETSEGDLILSGRLEIDYLNQKYDLELPSSENYSTLAGYLVTVLERIPDTGETLKINDKTIEVVEIDGNRINLLKIKK